MFIFLTTFLISSCASKKPILAKVTRGDIYRADRYCDDDGRRGILFLDAEKVECVNGEQRALNRIHYRD